MKAIVNVRRSCVYVCTMRGLEVEVWYADDHRIPMAIVDAESRRVLRWDLTEAEAAELDAIILEHYQPGGTT